MNGVRPLAEPLLCNDDRETVGNVTVVLLVARVHGMVDIVIAGALFVGLNVHPQQAVPAQAVAAGLKNTLFELCSRRPLNTVPALNAPGDLMNAIGTTIRASQGGPKKP